MALEFLCSKTDPWHHEWLFLQCSLYLNVLIAVQCLSTVYLIHYIYTTAHQPPIQRTDTHDTQSLCTCYTIKVSCRSVALTAPQQNNVSYSLCSVLLSPCILHVCPRKYLHYKCDMLAYNDAQHMGCLRHSSLRTFFTSVNLVHHIGQINVHYVH